MMKSFFALSICLCLFLAGCGAPRPAQIKEQGMRPINELKYYPYLTDSERKKFEKAWEMKPAKTTYNVEPIETVGGGGA